MLTHWKSTLIGGLIAGLIAISTLANADTLTKWQIGACFAASALTAMFGAVSADAKQKPQDPCPVCGK
jgi:hypothetical protein